MMCFPSMIAEAAKQAGMKVPPDPDSDFDIHEFPHFTVFCAVQLNRAITWGEHWENAKIIAAIPAEEIKKQSLEMLLARGLHYTQ